MEEEAFITLWLTSGYLNSNRYQIQHHMVAIRCGSRSQRFPFSFFMRYPLELDTPNTQKQWAIEKSTTLCISELFVSLNLFPKASKPDVNFASWLACKKRKKKKKWKKKVLSTMMLASSILNIAKANFAVDLISWSCRGRSPFFFFFFYVIDLTFKKLLATLYMQEYIVHGSLETRKNPLSSVPPLFWVVGWAWTGIFSIGFSSTIRREQKKALNSGKIEHSLPHNLDGLLRVFGAWKN